jgi:hypothetical protein
MIIPPIEAFPRYGRQKETASSNNLRKLEQPLAAVEKIADEIERICYEISWLRPFEWSAIMVWSSDCGSLLWSRTERAAGKSRGGESGIPVESTGLALFGW